jgi:hypothetical protein
MGFRPPLIGTEDLAVPATLVNPAGAPAAAQYDPDWACIVFPNGSTTVADLSFQIPHSAKLGTTAVFHMHWQPSSTDTTGTADFTLRYQWRNNDGAVGVAVASWATEPCTLTPGGVANALYYGNLCTLTKADGGLSSILQIRLERTGGTDGFTGDVRAMSFDCHIQIDSSGSTTPSSK